MIDRLEALERLARLRDGGVLTGAEFETEKARIIAIDAGAPQLAVTKDAHEEVTSRPPWAGRVALYRNRWVLGGAAVALIVGSALTYAVLGDIKSVTRPGSIAVVAKPAAQAASPTSLGTVLRFRDPGTCTPSEGLQDLLQTMIAARNTHNQAADATIRVAGFEEAIVPVVSKSDGSDGSPTIVEIAVPGTWQGLHVTRLHTATWGTDEVSALQIHFREPPEQSLSLLKQIGFPLSRVGELTQVGSSMMGLEAISGGSALTCARDARGGIERTPAKQGDSI